jgi:Phage integrase, N-terminal SAM-like domain
MEGRKATGPAGAGVIPNPKARLLDQVREVMRVTHYSLRTEQAYVAWMKRFIFSTRFSFPESFLKRFSIWSS